MKKDWNGNKKTAFAQLGASNHSDLERVQHDYYATDPKCAIDLINFLPELDNIWECACGEGHLAKVFQDFNKLARATDLIDRNSGAGVHDFLKTTLPVKYLTYILESISLESLDLGLPLNGGFKEVVWSGDIVTNPPYNLAEEFLLKAMDLLQDDRYYCAFLKLTWLEGKKRRKIFEKYPPKFVLVYSERQLCARNGEFSKYSSKAIAYCWDIWQKGFKGDTIVKWI